jgi:formate hydrogenlyase subunit 6/NADH:ubiquinone oxidoreductase subunit I
MTIDIMTRAKTGDPLWDNRCVGCGHCIDACPTETLAYSTRFLQHFTR